MENKKLNAFSLSLIVLGFIFVALLGIRTMASPDSWLMFAQGKAISEGGLKGVDVISYRAIEQVPVQQAWLLNALSTTIGSPEVVTLVHVFAVLMGLACLVRMSLRWGNGMAIALVMLLVGWLLAPRFEVRSSTFGLFYVGLFMLLLQGRMGLPKLLMWLVPLQILWANTAGNYMIGPFLGLFFAIDLFMTQDDDEGESGPKYFSLPIILLLVCLINPFGVGLLIDTFSYFTNAAQGMASYWISAYNDLFNSRIAAYSVNITLLVGALGLLFLKVRLPLAVTICAVFGALLSVSSIVSISLLAFLAFPFLVLSLQATGETIADRLQLVSGEKIAGFVALILFLGSLYTVASNQYYYATGNPARVGLGINDETVPVSFVQHLEEHELSLPGPLINLPIDGASLFALATTTNLPVYIDSRVNYHGASQYDLLYRALSGGTNQWDELIEETAGTLLLLNMTVTESPVMAQYMIFEKRWIPTYSDGTSLLLVAPTDENLPLLQNSSWKEKGLQEIEKARTLFQQNLNQGAVPPIPVRLIGAARTFYFLNQFEEAANLYKLLHHGLGGDILEFQFRYGVSLLNLNQSQEGIAVLEDVINQHTDHLPSYLYLAEAYKKQGQLDRMKEILDTARLLNPEVVARFEQANL